MELMEKMSYNPARLYKLDCGRMEAGAPADLVLFDADRQWTVEGFESKSSNSPFLGATLTGKVMYTVCKGRIVYGDQERKFDAILLDVDGTLLDFGMSEKQGMKVVLEQYGFEPTEERLLLYHEINEGFWSAFEREK